MSEHKLHQLPEEAPFTPAVNKVRPAVVPTDRPGEVATGRPSSVDFETAVAELEAELEARLSEKVPVGDHFRRRQK